MSPTRRTVAALGVATLSVLWWPAELAGVAVVVVLVLFLADSWSVRVAPAMARTVPTDVVRGEPAPFRVEAAGAASGGGHGPPGARRWVRQPQTGEVRLDPPEGPDRLEGTLVAATRGHHELPPFVTSTVGPLGLGRWVHRHGDQVAIASHADLPGGRRIAVSVQDGTFDDPGLRRGELGLGTDFETVRDYTPDDDIRRMNWRATERTGRPMVNQYRTDTERELWCLVDAGRLLSAPVGDRTRLDVALDGVAAVAAVADVVGDRVGAIAFDDQIRRELRPRRASAATLVRSLEALEPSVRDADYDAAFARVGAAKRSLVVVFTDLLDLAAARPLLDAVPVLVRRHAVVVAGVTDPDLVALAEPVTPVAPVAVGVPVTSAPSPLSGGAHRRHASIVAAELLDERRRAASRLTGLGAVVVDASVDRFPSACVSAYLRLKAVARI